MLRNILLPLLGVHTRKYNSEGSRVIQEFDLDNWCRKKPNCLGKNYEGNNQNYRDDYLALIFLKNVQKYVQRCN